MCPGRGPGRAEDPAGQSLGPLWHMLSRGLNEGSQVGRRYVRMLSVCSPQQTGHPNTHRPPHRQQLT